MFKPTEVRLLEKLQDKRGWILCLAPNVVLLYTKRGYRRGGDYHRSTQTDVCLTGAVVFYWRSGDGEHSALLLPGQSIQFPPNTPHYLEAVTDTLVLEWLEGEFEKEYDPEYRRRVEECLRE